MSLQRLYQQVQGAFKASPQTITLQFPAVPQGLVWTGSISLSVPYGEDLQGIIWTLLRNGQPFLTWSDFGVAGEVQAISQEVLTVVGTYLGPAASVPKFVITATWTGYSVEADQAPVMYPRVYGATRGQVQVYGPAGIGQPLSTTGTSQVYTSTTGGPGSSLDVTGVPAPGALQYAEASASASGQHTWLPAQTYPQYLWEIVVTIGMAYSGSTAGVYTLLVNVNHDGGVLASYQPACVQASVANIAHSINCHGLVLPAGYALTFYTGSFAGTYNVSCSVIYST